MHNTIGLDIGGTKIMGIVYDGNKILRELAITTPKTLPQFKISIKKLVAFLSDGKRVDQLGVGIPGVINQKGVTIFSPNMKFLIGFKIVEFCNDLGIKNVQVENDSNCFALAESKLGKGKQYKNFIGLILGTGIGGGLICNGRLLRGVHHSAGEAGQIMADFKYNSEQYFQIARDNKDYKKMGQVVGILFANIINLLDLDAIILGGGVAQTKHEKFMPEALATLKKHVINKNVQPKIIVSNLKDSGALGAALLCVKE